MVPRSFINRSFTFYSHLPTYYYTSLKHYTPYHVSISFPNSARLQVKRPTYRLRRTTQDIHFDPYDF